MRFAVDAVSRRFSGPSIAALAAVVAVLAAFMLVAPASAAHLDVKSSGIATTIIERCTTDNLIKATAPTTASTTTLELSAIPPSCQGLPIEVTIVDQNGYSVATGSAAAGASGPTKDVTVGLYTPSANLEVALFIGTWWIDNTWTAPTPVITTPPGVGPIVCYQLTAAGGLVLDGSGNPLKCATPASVSNVGTWGDEVYSPAYLQMEYSATFAAKQALLVFDFADSRYSAYAGNPTTSKIGFHSYYGGASKSTLFSCADRPLVGLVLTSPNPNQSLTLTGRLQMTNTGNLAGLTSYCS